jgi:hypothetical protein
VAALEALAHLCADFSFNSSTFRCGVGFLTLTDLAKLSQKLFAFPRCRFGAAGFVVEEPMAFDR